MQRGADQYQTYRPYEDRSRKQPATPNFDTRFLGPTMRNIGTKHKVLKVPEDSVNYVALALRARLHDLLVAMAAASAHRTESQFDRSPSTYTDGTPMWRVSVRRDVAKQLQALERVEREEEMRIRHERKEFAAVTFPLSFRILRWPSSGECDRHFPHGRRRPDTEVAARAAGSRETRSGIT